MKNIFTLAVWVWLAIGYAQTREEDEMYREMINTQISQLQLEGKTKEDFVAVSDRYFRRLLEIRESEASKVSKYSELLAMKKDKNREIEALLTEEEYSIYLELQAENRKRMKSIMKKK